MNELADPNLSENGDPREAIAKIGERGIPYLLNELQAEDSPIKRTVYRFSLSQSWLPDLHYRSADERRSLASLAFGALGPKAASSCSVLINLVLTAPSGGVRAAAVGALAEIGPFARSSTPALLVSLGDPEPNVRMASIYALTQIRGDVNSIFPPLIKMLADPDGYVCRSAIAALGTFKADARPALKSFEDHWSQFDRRNRSAAVFASARIDLKEAGPIMRLAMYDSDPWVQASCVRTLSRCTNQAGL